MLPIVIYERAGPISAAKSAWNNVRKTWTGLLVGTGLIYFAGWLLLNVVAGALFQGVLHLKPWTALVSSIVLGGIFYAVASSTAAALRATLYWYATTGEVPEGFDTADLPQMAAHAPFTVLAATGAVAATAPPTVRPAPAPSSAKPAPQATVTVQAKPKKVATATRRLTCPKCKTVATVPAGAWPVCANCGYGKGSA
jgi:hypothetical protein